MIDNSKQSTTLKVCLDDAGTHNRAILDFFFAKLGKHIFRSVSSQEEANVLLIDYDFPPARKRYEEEYQQWGKPALVLSIAEVSLDNAIWLSKPLTSRSLLDAAETLQKNIVITNTAVKPESTAVNALDSNVAELRPVIAEHKITSQGPPVLPDSPPVTIPLVEKAVAEAPVKDPEEQATSITSDEQQLQNVGAPDNANQNLEVAVAQDDSLKTMDANAEERSLSLCGNQQDVGSNADFKDFHVEDSFFLSSLKDAIRLARQCQQGVLLNFPQARIYVLPEIHRVFCGVNIYEDEFSELIKACSISEGGKMHILSTREIHELNEMISQQASALYDMEAFIWTATLLSAQGGLPRALDPKKPVGLKHWPSLTRLENFPYVMPIAALWSTSAMNAFDVAKSLNIPQRYVFSFYNASNSLGLIEQDSEKLITKQSAPRTKDAPRGLFSRLLKRLVGG